MYYRQSQDKQIEDKIEDVQEKLGVAISTLQQAIGGINEQVNATTTEVSVMSSIPMEDKFSHFCPNRRMMIYHKKVTTSHYKDYYPQIVVDPEADLKKGALSAANGLVPSVA